MIKKIDSIAIYTAHDVVKATYNYYILFLLNKPHPELNKKL